MHFLMMVTLMDFVCIASLLVFKYNMAVDTALESRIVWVHMYLFLWLQDTGFHMGSLACQTPRWLAHETMGEGVPCSLSDTTSTPTIYLGLSQLCSIYISEHFNTHNKPMPLQAALSV